VTEFEKTSLNLRVTQDLDDQLTGRADPLRRSRPVGRGRPRRSRRPATRRRERHRTVTGISVYVPPKRLPIATPDGTRSA